MPEAEHKYQTEYEYHSDLCGITLKAFETKRVRAPLSSDNNFMELNFYLESDC